MRVDFDDIHVSYGEIPVLRGVTLPVADGRFVGVLGPNGSGKSTLLRTLYRVVAPARGTVTVGGKDVRRLRPRVAAQTIGVMTQESPAEFDLTVLDVVLLGRVPHQRGFGRDTAEDLLIARSALHRVGADALAERQIGELSGGQKQRVLLARALAQESPVLVLDEPTNHLDVSFQLELMRLISGLGRTVIAALHDLNLAAAHCDEIAVLHDGLLAAHGPPREVLTPELVRDVFDVDATLLDHPGSDVPVLAFDHLPEPAMTRKPS